MERQHLGEYIVGKASGPGHLLRRLREELGKVSPSMGGLEGELHLQGKAPFPSTEKHVIYTEKEQEIKAGRGEQTAARRDFLVEGKRAAVDSSSSRSERIARNKSCPGPFCRLGCLWLFLFSHGLSKRKKKING